MTDHAAFKSLCKNIIPVQIFFSSLLRWIREKPWPLLLCIFYDTGLISVTENFSFVLKQLTYGEHTMLTHRKQGYQISLWFSEALQDKHYICYFFFHSAFIAHWLVLAQIVYEEEIRYITSMKGEGYAYSLCCRKELESIC